MSAARLLILGVLRIRQPIHGYDIRRELEAWRAEQWANIAYGSIYFALNKMADMGLIEVVDRDQTGKGPNRTTYTITQHGEETFQRLLREFWWQPKPITDPFLVALTFMNELPRDELLAALRHRVAHARGLAEAMSFAMTSPAMGESPRHIKENFRLSAEHAAAEARWVEHAIARVEAGELP
jgi:DNA-binding PadR family transcriptional regulator